MAFSNGTHPPLADGTTVEYLGRVEDLHHRMLTTRRGTSTYDTYTDENGTQQHLYDLLDDGELALSHVHPDDLTAWSPATDGNEQPLDSSSPQQG
ncbi:hypothetical protein DR950_33815 [Kitasatospora xanthocidica]|uniref:Uncharacterized protein n=1 Tax=Kitasatospora xanthocidica TaxID=83382 RepID=A0A373A1R2_9ACTN|nr:hypothetical protein [Kitasatospora xanthocidica]RGD62063.1 hypothetical protein DR950_33815 [Kitasatospora xanthocidica]